MSDPQVSLEAPRCRNIVVWIVAAFVLLGWLATGFYVVSVDEVAVVRVFGHAQRDQAGNIELITAARSAHGEIDLFFANAGVAIGTDPMDAEGTWETAFAINLHAHRWAARQLLPAWLERGEGYFCSTASAAGLLAQIGSAPYSVTKHGAVAFAEWLAITYGARGLRVSCLCPQGVNTDMLNSDVVGGGGGDVVRAVGTVLEPAEVADIVHDAIVEERFLILPHPEVGDYLRHKGDDPARWISGMQRLQQRTLGL